MRRIRTTRGTAMTSAALVLAAALAGCGDDDSAVSAPSGEGSPTARPPVSAGPFDAKSLVPKGYTVKSSTAMPLGPAGEADYRVVVSADPGAVKGGTENVQVFAFRDGAWAEVFDA